MVGAARSVKEIEYRGGYGPLFGPDGCLGVDKWDIRADWRVFLCSLFADGQKSGGPWGAAHLEGVFP